MRTVTLPQNWSPPKGNKPSSLGDVELRFEKLRSGQMDVALYVFGAVLLISLAFALFTSRSHRQDGFNPDSTDLPSAAGSGAEEQPVVSSPPASRSSPPVTLRWEDVVSRCHYLHDSETTGQLEQDCVSALDQWFEVVLVRWTVRGRK